MTTRTAEIVGDVAIGVNLLLLAFSLYHGAALVAGVQTLIIISLVTVRWLRAQVDPWWEAKLRQARADAAIAEAALAQVRQMEADVHASIGKEQAH